MAKTPALEEMLKAGMHFGHRTSKWHPKMEPYIYMEKGGIHIINLEITQAKLQEAMDYLQKMASENKLVLFIGTKNQVSLQLKKMASEIEMPYVYDKWLAGLLTNFSVVKRLIKKYKELKEKKLTGKLDKYTKKEKLNFEKEMDKLETRVGGLVKLERLPDAVFIWDIKKEETALKEAVKMKIPIIAVCDTNVNPEKVSYIIPSNDDATKSIKLILAKIKEAVMEGRSQRQNKNSG